MKMDFLNATAQRVAQYVIATMRNTGATA